ncbi:MAG: hypothetical protein C0471_18215 [Erythrobacter sp.]|nr:hypothetical protein [Erythrobacter sp.]
MVLADQISAGLLVSGSTDGMTDLPFAAIMGHSPAMISVCSPPTIDQDPGGDFQLCLWVLDVFNYDTPFREMSAEVARALGRDPHKDLQLPAYIADEDFVEGALVLEATSISVYFEHARSYLSMSHPSRSVLADILERLSPHIHVNR